MSKTYRRGGRESYNATKIQTLKWWKERKEKNRGKYIFQDVSDSDEKHASGTPTTVKVMRECG